MSQYLHENQRGSKRTLAPTNYSTNIIRAAGNNGFWKILMPLVHMVGRAIPVLYGASLCCGLHSAALLCTVWCCSVLCGVVLCGAVLCCAVWCCAVLCGVVLCGAVC